MRKSTCVLLFLTALALIALTGALPAQTINITAPTNSAVVPVGTPCTIGWNSAGFAPGTLLEISIVVPNAENQPVAGCLPVEAGQFQWQVPWASQAGSNCQVKIAIQGSGPVIYGTNYFILAPNPQPTLLLHAPAGGEQWPVGATRSVSWEPHNLTGTLTLKLRQGTSVVDTVSGIPVASNRFAYALPAGLAVGQDYTVQLTSDAAPLATAASPPFSVTLQTPAPRKWTMLFYFDAAAFMLEANTLQSFLDLGTITASTNINYVCQYARSPGYIANYLTNYPWWGVNRFVIEPGITPAASNAVQNLGNRAMCSPDTLTDFINWAVENYPAQNYFLILSDHGEGWAGGLLLDEVNGRHEMSTRQLQQALTAAAPMTVLGLDMCVEADTEVAYQLRNCGPQILIASQFKESRNWPYHTVFQQLQDKLPYDSLTLEGLATLFCQAFVDSHSGPMDSGTLGAIRLNQMDALTAAVAGFADTMSTNYQDSAAVRQQAGAVSTAFNNAVIYCARTKVLQQRTYGLNIYFPTSPTPEQTNTYGPAYVDFPVASHWANFLMTYGQSLTNTWISDARAACSQDDTTVDLSWFCQTINPATNTVRLTTVAVGTGGTTPSGNNLLFTNGQVIDLHAIPTQDPQFGTNYFVHWLAKANAIIADNSAEQTTARLTGDALIVAYFATNKNSFVVDFVTEGNGSLADTNFMDLTGPNSLTQVITAGGDGSPVVAVPDLGYVFAGWGGDCASAANPLAVTNVQMDMTLIAYFWPAPPTLSVRKAGTSLTLTWPAEATGYSLESSGNIVGGLWTAVPNVTTNSVTLPISNTNQFFRLSATANQ